MTAYGDTISGIAAESERSVEARLKAIARASLELYRADADALTFLIQGQGRFLAALDADFPYPIHVVERLMGSQPILPARFGTLLADDDEAVTALRTRHDELRRGLALVRGAVELGVRATWAQPPSQRAGTGTESA